MRDHSPTNLISVDYLIEAIKRTLEKTPPEISADLVDNGICLAGGGVLLRGLDKVIQHEIELPLTHCDDPLTAVVRGTGVILEQLDLLQAILETSRAN